jgi:perosamine synthetase
MVALLRYPVILRSSRHRDSLLERLQAVGLGATGMYPAPLHEIPGTSSYFDQRADCPAAKALSQRILTLPLHEHVAREDVVKIAMEFSQF